MEGKIRSLEQSVEALIVAYRQLLAENERLENEAVKWIARASQLESERDIARQKAVQLRKLVVNLTSHPPPGPSAEPLVEGEKALASLSPAVLALRKALQARGRG